MSAVNLAKYSKTLAFIIGAIVTIGGRILSEHYLSGSAEHWVADAVSLATLLGTGLGVYVVPNKPDPTQPLGSTPSAGAVTPVVEPQNNVQTFTAGVVMPLAVAPPTPVGDELTNALAIYPGLAEKVARIAPTHKFNGQPGTPAQYLAWLAAGCLGLR